MDLFTDAVTEAQGTARRPWLTRSGRTREWMEADSEGEMGRTGPRTLVQKAQSQPVRQLRFTLIKGERYLRVF
ncbi:hypothetical protein E2562_037232 [Oryza meyeriana var. granulata]|uniref:Uncharacterized protein n=1 Tax=Oryza meyeriana var. granulata TaxID=110450 RepID=A0A6G1ETP0_9ORYZ|nr:hypothetical protein E2562_037232 [Oryza meyeriana var. granulata]